MTIAEFLEARIAEDEAEALNAPKMSDVYDANRLAFTDALRKRVLDECAAKRAILAGRKRSDSSMADDEWTMGWSDANYDALYALAAVYEDHPDYQQEWASRG